jgi:hypothetical protein
VFRIFYSGSGKTVASFSTSKRRPALRELVVAIVLVLPLLAPQPSSAQRPFRIYDPFYRDEKPGRTFYDRFAVTGEVSYRPAGSVQGDGLTSLAADPIGYSLRFDYSLARHVDIGVIMDAAGTAEGRALSVGWVAIKYFQTFESTDYAFRLAVDPASDGQGGFPQLDAAFIYSAPLTPEVTTNYSIGVRRVRIGFEQLILLDGTDDPPVISAAYPDYGVLYSQALGWEVHAVLSYSALFDPAGSNIYFAILGEAGSYELIDQPLGEVGQNEANASAESGVSEFRGGVVWLRSGIEFSRPNYAFSPFLGLPVQQWQPDDGDWPSARLRLGLRLMIR